jgi:hypothetical protein
VDVLYKVQTGFTRRIRPWKLIGAIQKVGSRWHFVQEA